MSLANQLTALLSQRDEVADKAVMLGATLPESPTLKQIADALDALIRVYIPAYAAVYGGNTLIFGRGASAPASYEGMTLTAAFDSANGYNVETDLYGFDQDWETYTMPWYSYRYNITAVKFIAEVTPVRTSYWFMGLSKCTDWEISKLDTSKVEYMAQMFASTSGLAEDDLLGLNVSNVKNMYGMFQGTSAVSLDLSTWNTSNCTNFGSMFADTYSLKNLNLSGWDTTKATDMSYMFAYGNALETVTLGASWSFKGASPESSNWAWAQLQDGNWKHQESGNVYTAADLAAGYDGSTMSGTYELYIPAYAAVYKWTNPEPHPVYTTAPTYLVFGRGASAPSTYVETYSDVSGYEFDYSYELVEEYSASTGFDIETLEVNIPTASTDVPWYADYRAAITKVIVIDQIKPVDLDFWFCGFRNCTTMNLTKLDTTNVVSMYSTFATCTSLTSLNLSTFKTSNVSNLTCMFQNCSNLTTIYVSDLWSTDAVTSSGNMFYGCTKLKGDIAFNSSKVDKTYAKTSGGYLTYKAAPV